MDKVCPCVNFCVFRRRVGFESPTLTLFFSLLGIINSHVSQIISSTEARKRTKKRLLCCRCSLCATLVCSVFMVVMVSCWWSKCDVIGLSHTHTRIRIQSTAVLKAPGWRKSCRSCENAEVRHLKLSSPSHPSSEAYFCCFRWLVFSFCL